LIFLSLIFVQLIVLLILSHLIKAETVEVVEEKNKLTAYEQKNQNLVQLSQDYEYLTNDLGFLEEVLPDKEGIIDFLDELDKEASSAGILAKLSFSPQSVKVESGVKSVNFNLNFKSSYHKMVELIKKIEKMPQVVVVEIITIQSPNGLEGESNVNLNLKCFLDPDF